MSPADLERLERERLDADRRYNEALTALDRAVVDFASRSDVTGGDVPHLGSLLLIFLQQITAYVDTKDREATAAMLAALDTDRRTLASIPELGQQIALLQRAVQALTRERQTVP